MAGRIHDETTPLQNTDVPVAALDERAYFVVFDGNTSQKFVLSGDDELLIGRADDAQLRLRSPSVSRRHARVLLRAGEWRISDLGSHNGVSVNGKPVPGDHALRTRDIVTLGNVTLIFYAGLRAQKRRAMLELKELRARAAVLVKAGKPFSLLALAPRVSLGGQEPVEEALPRGHEAAWNGSQQLLVLLPGAGSDEAAATAAAFLAGVEEVTQAKAGYACFPQHGATVDDLITHAGAAVMSAATGQFASEPPRSIAISGMSVLVADPAMVRLYALLEKLAQSDLPILIGGETGVGKELAASAVHHWSARTGRPFVALNCAALPENLAESELFGHEKGAFSGAVAAKPGLLESARGGTVFLDEIGELSMAVQAKLLRVLETRRVMRVGDVKEREIDMRIIAATNRDLEGEIAAGRFRKDLYFRLSGATVWLPPLRDRPHEIAMLARSFLDTASARMGRPPTSLAPATTQILLRYAWPGNIRELKNVMEFVVAATREQVVEPEHLPARVLPSPITADRTLDGPVVAATSFRPIEEELRELEKTRMTAALAACDGNQTKAAELIDMPRRTFVAKLKQYGLLKKDG